MERELFVLLMGVLDSTIGSFHRPSKCQFRDRDIILVWLWAVLHDRPIDWACRRCNWPWHDRTRPLPSGSTMSRRLRCASVCDLKQAVLVALRITDDVASRLLIMDGKPLMVSGNSADRDVGFGRACGVMGRGYKLHAIMDLAENTLVYEVLPLNISEQHAARLMLARLNAPPGTQLLADANYDASSLYDLAAARGVQMIAPNRCRNARGLGHRYQSPHRLRALELQRLDPDVLRPRRRIESAFGTLGNVIGGLAPLPNSVRGLARVQRWVTGKLIIDAAHRRRRRGKLTA